MGGGSGAGGGRVVVGVDAGGSTTRAVVCDLRGRRLGRGRAGGGNPGALGPRAAANLAAAVRRALEAAEDVEPVGAVVGLAGVSALREPGPRSAVEGALREAGVRPHITGDDVVAFAAGTAEADGCVLIAGTGAVAARIEGRRRIRTADGLGWQLGDEGSGFWIGRRAAKATVHRLAAGAEPGPLARAVRDQVLGTDPGAWPQAPDELARAFAARLLGRAPLTLAGLAPLVGAAAREGDPVAVAIVEEAAARLVRTVGRVRAPGERSPVVLAGGVLTGSSAVREALTRRLARSGGAPVVTAGDTAGAAAWLAAVRTGEVSARAGVHAAFTRVFAGPEG